MTLTQLKYITSVYRAGSFHGAAKECHISQPTLSAQIQKIEAELGVTIFDRSKNPITPTKIGLKIIIQAIDSLCEINKIKEIVTAEKESISGSLNVGIIPTLSPYVTPLLLQGFCKQYPDVELSLTEIPTEICLQQLNNEEIDAALLATSEKEDLFDQRHLFDEKLFLFVNQDSDLANKKDILLKDIEAKNVWLLEEGHCLRDEIIGLCKLKKVDGHRPSNIDFKTGSLESLRYIIKNNFGYTLIPELSLPHLSAEESKSVRAFTEPQPSRPLYLTTRKKYLKSILIGRLADSISESIKNQCDEFSIN